LADEDARRIAQVMRQREADSVDGDGVERELAGNAANAVGAKELLHRIYLHIYYRAFCRRVAVRHLSQAGTRLR